MSIEALPCPFCGNPMYPIPTEHQLNGGYGPFYSGEDWLALANEIRIDLAEVCGELKDGGR